MVIRNLFKQITTLTLFLSLSVSCSSNPNKEKNKLTDVNTGQNLDHHIIYGNLIINDKSDYLMIPVNVANGNQEENFLFGLLSI